MSTAVNIDLLSLNLPRFINADVQMHNNSNNSSAADRSFSSDPTFKQLSRTPLVPEAVLRRNNAYNAVDTRFAAASRLQQALWLKRQNIATVADVHPGSEGSLGTILSADAARAGRNFLSADVHQYAVRECLFSEPDAAIDPFRLMHNSLSSMPLCVSLLGPLACGISTGAGAVLNALRPHPGSSIVVYGAGAVGLSAIMAARLTAATHIIAVDKLASRLALATELGATETIDLSSGADPVAAVREICDGPADFSLDCAGNVDVLRQAADSVGMRGTVALIGGAPAGASFSLDHMSTLWGKKVVGILGGEGRSVSLINTLITLNSQGRFPYDRLIEKFPLDQVNEALEASHRGDVIKPVLTMPE